MREQLGLNFARKGIARAAAASPRLVLDALAVIRGIASQDEFTTDVLPASLGERRALGAAMRQAVVLGLIEPTGRWERSTDPTCHARPKAVWRRR